MNIERVYRVSPSTVCAWGYFYVKLELVWYNCIEYHGVSCKICGINFEEVYGEIGKGFIYVYHIKPISEIDEKYAVDYKNDLIHVCPNCHAMLHRKIGRNLSIKKLRKLIKNS